jgi:hypothetical protein
MSDFNPGELVIFYWRTRFNPADLNEGDRDLALSIFSDGTVEHKIVDGTGFPASEYDSFRVYQSNDKMQPWLAQSLANHLLETIIALDKMNPLEGKKDVEVSKGETYHYLSAMHLREGKDFSWTTPGQPDPKLQQYIDTLNRIESYMLKGESLRSHFRLGASDPFYELNR